MAQYYRLFVYMITSPPVQHIVSGPPSARQRNAIQMTFCWRANDGPFSDVYWACGEKIMFYGEINLYKWRLNIIILAVSLFMCVIIHTRVCS